jgi:Rps23 Pro-64 3,4-dihydroxylase Tpa1-like proline 4-hydroxylase|tara:strand:+ start:1312 stop:1947 length:636 start_codon:yes stop_codon:yes gene_type:complete
MKDWIAQIGGDQPFPFLVIDNWYDKETEKSIWSELDFLSTKNKQEQLRAENTIVARNEDGTSKSKAYRWYLESIYTEEGRTYSTIMQKTDLFRTPEFHEIIQHITPQCRSFLGSDFDTTIISYYENNDYYKAHYDKFQWTSLIWFYREPKKFKGGNLKFTEPNYEIKVKHNRLLMFPCYYLHEVLPIKTKKFEQMGNGRYTITHFFYSGDK